MGAVLYDGKRIMFEEAAITEIIKIRKSIEGIQRASESVASAVGVPHKDDHGSEWTLVELINSIDNAARML